MLDIKYLLGWITKFKGNKMKFNFSKEWCEQAAKTEAGIGVAAYNPNIFKEHKMTKIKPEVAKAARNILLLLKRGKRTSEYLSKKVGTYTYSAIVWLALQDLISTGVRTTEEDMKILDSLMAMSSGEKRTKLKPALYFLSKRGKEVVELLIEETK